MPYRVRMELCLLLRISRQQTDNRLGLRRAKVRMDRGLASRLSTIQGYDVHGSFGCDKIECRMACAACMHPTTSRTRECGLKCRCSDIDCRPISEPLVSGVGGILAGREKAAGDDGRPRTSKSGRNPGTACFAKQISSASRRNMLDSGRCAPPGIRRSPRGGFTEQRDPCEPPTTELCL